MREMLSRIVTIKNNDESMGELFSYKKVKIK
jgi:hypothetical protein